MPFLLPDGFHFPWGGLWALPHGVVILLGVFSFMTKVAFFNWLFMQIRWTLPRFRYDQLMHLGWKVMLPLALANIVVTAVIILVCRSL